MTDGTSFAVRFRSLVVAAEDLSGLGTLDPRSRDIIYFVAERELSGKETAVSHIILNDRFGSLGTVQRHLYALIAERWLMAHAAEDDARRKDVRLGEKSREAFGKMSEMLRKRVAGNPAIEVSNDT